jgi:hypothetical protein
MFSHAAACKGPISVTIHTGIAASPKSQSGDGSKEQPTSMQETNFFSLANGSHLQLDITRANRRVTVLSFTNRSMSP